MIFLKPSRHCITIVIACIYLLALMPDAAAAQACGPGDDLLKIPGTYTGHNATPAGGFVSFYTAPEKNTAVKIMTALETVFKKDFQLHGGTGKGVFHFREGAYFGKNFIFPYSFNTGFYHFLCENGVVQPAHEYGTSLEITANATINPFFSLPHELAAYESMFYTTASRKIGYRMISIFSYLVLESPGEVEKINTGTGYTDSKEYLHDAYDKHPDMYRTWYITKPGSKILVEVSRKEYLESLLAYYDAEKKAISIKNENLLRESKEYMARYEKNGNREMYESHRDKVLKAEKELAATALRYEEKKGKVMAILQERPANWLQQPAVINPGMRNNSYCNNSEDFKKTGYFTFAGFYEGGNGCTVYQWSPGLFKKPGATTPVFFKISLRYKKDWPFSTAIKDHFSGHLDFDAIRKLL